MRRFNASHLSRDGPETSTMYTAEDKMKTITPYQAKRAARIVRMRLVGDKNEGRR